MTVRDVTSSINVDSFLAAPGVASPLTSPTRAPLEVSRVQFFNPARNSVFANTNFDWTLVQIKANSAGGGTGAGSYVSSYVTSGTYTGVGLAAAGRAAALMKNGKLVTGK